MELYQLEYFRVLCKYGSYTSASQELNVSLPAISMAIRKLEDECGGDIINRESKNFALTPKGEVLQSWAVKIHNDVDSLCRDLDAFSLRQREIIRLALPFPLCPELLTERIPRFSSENTDVALHILQEGHAHIIANLMNQSVDLGVICRDFLTDALESRRYKALEYAACFPPRHPLAGSERVTPAQLQGETLLVPKIANTISKAVDEYFRGLDTPPQFRYVDVFPADVWQLAARGEGIAFIPRHAAEADSVPLDPPLCSELVLVWRRGETLTKKKRELIDFLCGAEEP